MKPYGILLLITLLFSCQQENHLDEETKVQIRAELVEIDKVDQHFAAIPPQDYFDRYGRQKAWDVFTQQRDSVSRLHQAQINEWYEKYGYLGIEQVGEEGANTFWLVIQHADNNLPFQEKMLAAMQKEVEKNNVNKSNYALLEDRIHVNTGKKQRFGTQVTYNDKGQAIPKIGLIDSLRVDEYRLAHDLPTLKEYYNGMIEMHFEMNKAYLEGKGITEPQFYK
jgi:hypothetical protein